MAVTGISYDASGPANPGDEGRIRFLRCNVAAFKPDSSDLLHPPASASVMVVVVAARGWRARRWGRGGGEWAYARPHARDSSLHSTSTLHPLAYLPSICAPSSLSPKKTNYNE